MAEADGPPASTAAILHVDMDAFFAAVEVLHDPSLAGRPVIVGGSGGRGVVASCTYEARAYGVRSAMPSLRARQLCPAAVFVDGHYERYAEMSRRMHDLLRAVTPLVEPIGLDEAFLNVAGARRLRGEPEAIAHALRRAVGEVLSLDCSIGVGRSKLVAKLASRAAKPLADRRGPRPGPGVVVVAPEDELAFLHPLPVEALWGVGPASARRLHALGLRTVGDIARVPEHTLVRAFGRAHGTHLAALARADDPSPVVPDRPAKSVGHEETFASDIFEPADLRRTATRHAEAVADHLRKGDLAARTVTVKVRFADFSTITRSHTLPFALDTAASLTAVAHALLASVDAGPGVRLLGLSASGLRPQGEFRQLAFDLAGPPGGSHAGTDPGTGVGPSAPEAARRAARLQESWHDLSAAVDAIRGRFGVGAVGAASMVRHDGLDVPAQRTQPWGPDDEPSPG